MRAPRGSAAWPALLLAVVACLLAPPAEAYTDPQEGAFASRFGHAPVASQLSHAAPACASPQAAWAP